VSDTPAREWLEALVQAYPDVELRPPAAEPLIADAEKTLGRPLPPELVETLLRSNGLACRSFVLYPVHDPANPKKTWESLQRVNEQARSEVFGDDEELATRFLIFADIGGGVAMFDGVNGSIWMKEGHESDLDELTLTFRPFVEVMAKNAE
jgi:hypothetical protein